jgi:hypothetical protein
MATELTSMTEMFGIIFITRNDIGANKLGQSFPAKVSETTLMPKRAGGGNKGGGAGGGQEELIEVIGAIAPGDHVLGLHVLHRNTKQVKFDGTIIVSGKTMNRNQTLNDARGD